MTPLYDITQAYYASLADKAERNEQAEIVFTGSLLEVFKQTGGSSRYYSLVRELLLSPLTDPCIEIRQRGNASQPSIVILLHPPPGEWANVSPGDLTREREGATLGEVDRRLAAIESWRESNFREVNVGEVLRDFEKRLTLLEGERE